MKARFRAATAIGKRVQETRVADVDFRTLDQTLAQVGMVGGKARTMKVSHSISR